MRAVAHTEQKWGGPMFAIIGILVVFGAVVGGYLMEHGNLKVLLQPAELLIIGGARPRNDPDCQSAGRAEGHPGGLVESVFGNSKYDKALTRTR